MILLGVDPGLICAGFGIIKKEQGKAFLLDYGYLQQQSKKPLVHRVGRFYSFMAEKIQKHGVTDVALETPFLGKNAQNFLKLGYLRGVLYLLADQHELRLHEFSPRDVKLSVTGYGGASKEQVANVVQRLFPGLGHQKKNDVTDALAVTLCGLWRAKNSSLL